MIRRLTNGMQRAREVAVALRALAKDPTIKKNMTTYMTQVDARQSNRQYLGRSISPDKIQTALRSAYSGVMGPITDISRETIDTDPHLGSVLFKRFGAVTTLPYEIFPAVGQGIDKDKAKYYEEVVREYLFTIPNLRQRILQISWALFDGRSVLENMWRPVTTAGSKYGRVSIVPRNLEWIHPRRLSFGPCRELVITDDQTYGGGNFSPVGYSLHPDDLARTDNTAKFSIWTPSLFCEYQEREGLSPRALYWSFHKRFSQRERMVLIELFGKPWRVITVDSDADAGAEDLEAADTAADQLGGSSSARMPRGTKLDVIQLDANSSQNHQEVIKDCDHQLSKLILGQTGTTDPNPAGLNNTQASVMQDEQSVIQLFDAKTIGEVITDQLVKQIIERNFGVEELSHCPNFVLRWDKPTSRQADLDRLRTALDAGVEVALEEAYESSGFRKPNEDEPRLRIDQPQQTVGSANPPQPRAVIIHPAGQSPEAGEQNPAAPVASTEDGSREDAAGMISTADLAKTVTVNEARAAQGLPPLTLPDGKPDPDGELTLVEFEAKKAADVAPTGYGFTNHGGNRIEVVNRPIELRGHYESIKALTNSDIATRMMAEAEAGESHVDYWFALANGGEDDLADHEQPTTDNGSPDDIVDRGSKGIFSQTGKWATQIKGAVIGLGTASAIYDAVNRVGDDINTQPYARVMERNMSQTAAMAALDSSVDIGGTDIPGFSKMPFRQAMIEFKKKGVVTRATWDKLEAEIKRKSFTVAGFESNVMIQTTHAELVKQIGLGADLKEFSKFLDEKFRSAGLIKPAKGIGSGAHVDTVFRTNVLNSYGAGRHSHMSQPSVLRVRPIWSISSVSDSHTRKDHRRANGLNLYATDMFWRRAYAPFGFNCRCRIISRSLTSNMTITPGSKILYLPDPGFTSGTGNLLS